VLIPAVRDAAPTAATTAPRQLDQKLCSKHGAQPSPAAHAEAWSIADGSIKSINYCTWNRPAPNRQVQQPVVKLPNNGSLLRRSTPVRGWQFRAEGRTLPGTSARRPPRGHDGTTMARRRGWPIAHGDEPIHALAPVFAAHLPSYERRMSRKCLAFKTTSAAAAGPDVSSRSDAERFGPPLGSGPVMRSREHGEDVTEATGARSPWCGRYSKRCALEAAKASRRCRQGSKAASGNVGHGCQI
jgi:hypothetical protein